MLVEPSIVFISPGVSLTRGRSYLQQQKSKLITYYMSLLPSIESIKREVTVGKSKQEYTQENIQRGLCPLCGNKLREDARWLFCYRPSKHDMFRASKEKYGKAVNHSVPWDNPATIGKPSGNQKKTKKRRNNFKANVSKKSRKEWGARMQFFSSL